MEQILRSFRSDLSRDKSDDLSSDLARERGIYEITLSE